MKFVKDLGMRKYTTKNGYTKNRRYGLYLCPGCFHLIEMLTGQVNYAKTPLCYSCAHKKRATTHNKSKTTKYRRWNSMKGRCFNSKTNRYKNYGARGITICKEWCEDYETYEAYIGSLDNAHKKGYSVDRIDNDGNYEPGNIKWSTAKEQANNRSNNK